MNIGTLEEARNFGRVALAILRPEALPYGERKVIRKKARRIERAEDLSTAAKRIWELVAFWQKKGGAR